MLAGSAGIALLTAASSPALIIGITLVFGISLGTNIAGNQTALYAQARPEQVGTASGLYRTFSYGGSIAASAISGTVFRTTVDSRGLHTIAFILVGVAAIVVVMTVADRRLPIRPLQSQQGSRQGELVTDSAPASRHASTLLLVMDYQPGVIDTLGPLVDTDELLGRVATAIKVVRRAGGQVGFVRSAFDDRDYSAIPGSNKVFAPHAATRYLHTEDPASGVHGRLAPEPGDLMIRKTRLGAFSTSDLQDQLRGSGITTLILAGIHTKGVLLSTVVEAVDRDYTTYVLSDASADADPSLHDVLTKKVFTFQANVITVAELEHIA
jgi:nicotinamidase-related amidase